MGPNAKYTIRCLNNFCTLILSMASLAGRGCPEEVAVIGGQEGSRATEGRQLQLFVVIEMD